MSLFNHGDFLLHSGSRSKYLIDCNAFSDEDLETFAKIIADDCVFSSVYGIPRGGLRLAEHLEKYKSSTGIHIIVDDVLTTGKSMKKAKKLYPTNSLGYVIISRLEKADVPWWITSLLYCTF